MKKLKKILLINWLYFSKELIEVGDINFLTGKKAPESQRSSMHCRSYCWARPTPATLIRRPTKNRSVHWKAICAPTWMITARIPVVVRTFPPILSANFRMRWRAAAL